MAPSKRPPETELAARLGAQLLAGEPASSPGAVAERLLAIQGQDARGARLAVRARTRGLRASDVDGALDEGSLLITWLNRGTLHLVRSEDYWLLQELTTPQLRVSSDRRLGQEGFTPSMVENGINEVRRAIAAGGPQTRDELCRALERAGVPTAGQAVIQLLFRAAIEGVIVRGPMRGKQHCYVLVEEWLPKRPRFDRAAALAELARRYLAGHAPAGDRDLAKWAGITLGDARAALAAAGSPRPARATDPAPVKLLGAFDPVLLGWADRTPILPPARAGDVISGGIFRPFVLADGRAAGTWRLDRGRPQIDTWRRLPSRALAAESADVERFLAS